MISIRTSTSTPVIASSVPSMPSTASARSASKPACPVTYAASGLAVRPRHDLAHRGDVAHHRVGVVLAVEDRQQDHRRRVVGRERPTAGSAGRACGPTSPQATPLGAPTPTRSGSGAVPQIASSVVGDLARCCGARRRPSARRTRRPTSTSGPPRKRVLSSVVHLASTRRRGRGTSRSRRRALPAASAAASRGRRRARSRRR